MTPEVSVVIAVHNGARYIGEALASVLGQKLDRPMPRLQIIVVDDGSTDDSGAVATKSAAIELIKQPNQGQAAALNVGLAQARAPLLAFIDANDLWTTDKLQLQMAALARRLRSRWRLWPCGAIRRSVRGTGTASGLCRAPAATCPTDGRVAGSLAGL